MIYINLLPEQYRKKQRPPLKALAAMAGIVAVNASLAAYLSWLHFTVAKSVQSELDVSKDCWSSIEPQTEYHDSLQTESKQYASRETTLQGMTKSRVSWTRKLDLLVDLVNDGSEQDKYLLWFDDLTVAQTADNKRKSLGSFKASGHCGSDNFALVANFLDDLQRSPFSQGFAPPAPVQGSQSDFDETLVPAREWSFPLDLTMEAPEEPKPAPKKKEKKAGTEEQE